MPSSNLSLGALGFAVGANGNSTTETFLGADGYGSPGTQTAMGHFVISAVVGMTVPDTTPNESTSSTATVTFANPGSYFASRIRNRSDNFTWVEVLNPSKFTLTTPSDYTAPIAYLAVTLNENISFKVKFKDSYNVGATNYNTYILETATIMETGGGGRR